MTTEDLRIICSRVSSELYFEYKIGMRTLEETNQMADKATIEAFKLELVLEEN